MVSCLLRWFGTFGHCLIFTVTCSYFLTYIFIVAVIEFARLLLAIFWPEALLWAKIKNNCYLTFITTNICSLTLNIISYFLPYIINFGFYITYSNIGYCCKFFKLIHQCCLFLSSITTVVYFWTVFLIVLLPFV